MSKPEPDFRHIPATTQMTVELQRELDQAELHQQFANAEKHRAGAIEELMNDLP